MGFYALTQREGLFFRGVMHALLVCFITSSIIITPGGSYAQPVSVSVLPYMPLPSQLISTSPRFEPLLLRGIQFHHNNLFRFNFIVDPGGSSISGEALKEEARRLIKYFLSSLTIPEEDLWVNLSPYEKDRVIPSELGLTEMGKDLLGEDYILKQLIASLTYPESPLGKQFWDKVYERAFHLFGTTKIPINTFNKIWIVPDKAVVYEDTDRAYIGEARLKVMMEEDYLALQRNLKNPQIKTDTIQDEKTRDINTFSSAIMKEVVLPVIEDEINNGKNFAYLRQIYYSLILAVWFKKKLKQTILEKAYVNKKKIKGVDVSDELIKEKIYAQYVEAYKKGVYDYIKPNYDPGLKRDLKRRYFSGGADFTNIGTSSAITVLSYSQVPRQSLASSSSMEVQLTPVSGEPTHDPRRMTQDLGKRNEGRGTTAREARLDEGRPDKQSLDSAVQSESSPKGTGAQSVGRAERDETKNVSSPMSMEQKVRQLFLLLGIGNVGISEVKEQLEEAVKRVIQNVMGNMRQIPWALRNRVLPLMRAVMSERPALKESADSHRAEAAARANDYIEEHLKAETPFKDIDLKEALEHIWNVVYSFFADELHLKEDVYWEILQKIVSQARKEAGLVNANAGLTFGTELFNGIDKPFTHFLLVAIHELTHNILFAEGVSTEHLNNKIIHEFIADLAILTFLQMTGNEEVAGMWKDFLKYSEDLDALEGNDYFSDKEHAAARAQIEIIFKAIQKYNNHEGNNDLHLSVDWIEVLGLALDAVRRGRVYDLHGLVDNILSHYFRERSGAQGARMSLFAGMFEGIDTGVVRAPDYSKIFKYGLAEVVSPEEIAFIIKKAMLSSQGFDEGQVSGILGEQRRQMAAQDFAEALSLLHADSILDTSDTPGLLPRVQDNGYKQTVGKNQAMSGITAKQSPVTSAQGTSEPVHKSQDTRSERSEAKPPRRGQDTRGDERRGMTADDSTRDEGEYAGRKTGDKETWKNAGKSFDQASSSIVLKDFFTRRIDTMKESLKGSSARLDTTPLEDSKKRIAERISRQEEDLKKVEDLRNMLKEDSVRGFIDALKQQGDGVVKDLSDGQKRAVDVVEAFLKDNSDFSLNRNEVVIVERDTWVARFMNFDARGSIYHFTGTKDSGYVILIDSALKELPLIKTLLHEAVHKKFQNGRDVLAQKKNDVSALRQSLEEAMVEVLTGDLLAELAQQSKQVRTLILSSLDRNAVEVRTLIEIVGEEAAAEFYAGRILRSYVFERGFLEVMFEKWQGRIEGPMNSFLQNGDEVDLKAVIGESWDGIARIAEHVSVYKHLKSLAYRLMADGIREKLSPDTFKAVEMLLESADTADDDALFDELFELFSNKEDPALWVGNTYRKAVDSAAIKLFTQEILRAKSLDVSAFKEKIDSIVLDYVREAVYEEIDREHESLLSAVFGSKAILGRLLSSMDDDMQSEEAVLDNSGQQDGGNSAGSPVTSKQQASSGIEISKQINAAEEILKSIRDELYIPFSGGSYRSRITEGQWNAYKRVLSEQGMDPQSIVKRYIENNQKTIIVEHVDSARSLNSFLDLLGNWAKEQIPSEEQGIFRTALVVHILNPQDRAIGNDRIAFGERAYQSVNSELIRSLRISDPYEDSLGVFYPSRRWEDSSIVHDEIGVNAGRVMFMIVDFLAGKHIALNNAHPAVQWYNSLSEQEKRSLAQDARNILGAMHPDRGKPYVLSDEKQLAHLIDESQSLFERYPHDRIISLGRTPLWFTFTGSLLPGNPLPSVSRTDQVSGNSSSSIEELIDALHDQALTPDNSVRIVYALRDRGVKTKSRTVAEQILKGLADFAVAGKDTLEQSIFDGVVWAVDEIMRNSRAITVDDNLPEFKTTVADVAMPKSTPAAVLEIGDKVVASLAEKTNNPESYHNLVELLRPIVEVYSAQESKQVLNALEKMLQENSSIAADNSVLRANMQEALINSIQYILSTHPQLIDDEAVKPVVSFMQSIASLSDKQIQQSYPDERMFRSLTTFFNTVAQDEKAVQLSAVDASMIDPLARFLTLAIPNNGTLEVQSVIDRIAAARPDLKDDARKASAEALRRQNTAIQQRIKDTDLRVQEIVAQSLSEQAIDSMLGMPEDAGEQTKFERTVQQFKQYADRYFADKGSVEAIRRGEKMDPVEAVIFAWVRSFAEDQDRYGLKQSTYWNVLRKIALFAESANTPDNADHDFRFDRNLLTADRVQDFLRAMQHEFRHNLLDMELGYFGDTFDERVTHEFDALLKEFSGQDSSVAKNTLKAINDILIRNRIDPMENEYGVAVVELQAMMLEFGDAIDWSILAQKHYQMVKNDPEAAFADRVEQLNDDYRETTRNRAKVTSSSLSVDTVLKEISDRAVVIKNKEGAVFTVSVQRGIQGKSVSLYLVNSEKSRSEDPVLMFDVGPSGFDNIRMSLNRVFFNNEEYDYSDELIGGQLHELLVSILPEGTQMKALINNDVTRAAIADRFEVVNGFVVRKADRAIVRSLLDVFEKTPVAMWFKYEGAVHIDDLNMGSMERKDDINVIRYLLTNIRDGQTEEFSISFTKSNSYLDSAGQNTSPALAKPEGGINLDASHLNIEMRGEGVMAPAGSIEIDLEHFEGFTFEIIAFEKIHKDYGEKPAKIIESASAR